MSIWGTLAGTAVGVITGNPAAGVAVGGAVNAATDSGNATSCPGQLNSELQWLMGVISDSDLRAWADVATRNGLKGDDGTPIGSKILAKNAVGVAFDLAGGKDCKPGKSGGAVEWTQYTLNLLSRYQSALNVPPTPTTVNTPPSAGTSITGGVTVTGPGGTTATFGTSPSAAAATLPVLSNPILLAAVAVAVLVLVVK